MIKKFVLSQNLQKKKLEHSNCEKTPKVFNFSSS
jgi:hypothetical protein